jgi:hypothetical protein
MQDTGFRIQDSGYLLYFWAWYIIKVTLLKSGKEFSHGLNTDKHG